MEVQNNDTYSNMTKHVDTFDTGEKDNSFDGTVVVIDPGSGFGDILGGIEEDEWTYVNNKDHSMFMKAVETNTIPQQQPPCIIL